MIENRQLVCRTLNVLLTRPLRVYPTLVRLRWRKKRKGFGEDFLSLGRGVEEKIRTLKWVHFFAWRVTKKKASRKLVEAAHLYYYTASGKI